MTNNQNSQDAKRQATLTAIAEADIDAKFGVLEDLAIDAIKHDAADELLIDINLSTMSGNASIDPSGIYCVKTGQPIGTMQPDMLRAMMQVHGLQRSQDLLPYLQYSAIAPHWLDTSPDALDKLMAIDPIGYFVFCATKACEYRRDGYSLAKRHWTDNAKRTQFMQEKIKLWQDLQFCALGDIHKANVAWQIFLGFTHPQYSPISSGNSLGKAAEGKPYYHLTDFAKPEILTALGTTLATALKRSIQKRVEFEIMSYNDIGNLREKMGGNTAIMRQKKQKAETDYDKLKRDLDAFLPDFNLSDQSELDVSILKPARYSGKIYREPEIKAKVVVDKEAPVSSPNSLIMNLATMPKPAEPKKTLAELLAAKKAKE